MIIFYFKSNDILNTHNEEYLKTNYFNYWVLNYLH